MPFSFSTFGLPVIFGIVLLVIMVMLIVNCLRTSPTHPLAAREPEKPKLWDLFVERPIGATCDEATWSRILPLSAERLGTTQWHTPAPKAAASPAPVAATGPAPWQKFHRRKAAEFGNISHLQIAVAIVMPPHTHTHTHNDPQDERNENERNETEEEFMSLDYCIGLQQTAVVGDLQ